MTHASRKRNRVYVRKFDHEEAQLRYDAGENTVALAQAYGVTPSAVWQVVTEAGRRSRAARGERVKGAGQCDRCAAPMNQQSRINGSRLCLSCAFDDSATSVRPGALQCVTCREWKPDEGFPFGTGNQRRRGRHKHCRSCSTRLRQDYRERHKVPCIGCGQLCLPPGEKGSSGSLFARCRRCARAGVQLTAEEVGRPSRSTEASD